MKAIYYIDREDGKKKLEEVFGEDAVRFLYGSSLLSKTVGYIMLHLLAKRRFCSRFYGWLQTRPFSKKTIIPFVKRFDIDTSEFSSPISSYTCFNDFFIRKLKPEARPIADTPAVIPADGRYRFFTEIRKSDTITVKTRPFCLETVLQSKELADRYDGGSVVMARLCPTDCHRFYFPFDCTASKSKYINGKLFSVNPIAIRDNPWIWGVNCRVATTLVSKQFGTVTYMEVGATNVGSIIQTYNNNEVQRKGDEKGYFSFGGSALLLFFERGKITFDKDLLHHDLEVRCLIGQSLGH